MILKDPNIFQYTNMQNKTLRQIPEITGISR